MIVLLPHPEWPTRPTFCPAGITALNILKTGLALLGYLNVISRNSMCPYYTFLILPVYSRTSIKLFSSIISNIFWADSLAYVALGTDDIANPAPNAEVKRT